MTESNLGPATPGTAARREGLIERRDASGALHDFYGDTACSSHMPEKCRACEYDRLKNEVPALRDRLHDYRRAVAARDEIIAAADAGIHRDLEVSRLKAENASLLESLRAAREQLAEEGADHNATGNRLRDAEQRNTELEGALRALLVYRQHRSGCAIDPTDFCTCGLREVSVRARAALHDEERSAPPQAPRALAGYACAVWRCGGVVQNSGDYCARHLGVAAQGEEK